MDEINLFTYENWRDVVGYEGLYEVSNLGRVRSLDRMVWNEHNRTYSLCKGRILKPQLHRDGYQQVCLYNDGTKKIHTLHRLVADAFIPNPQNLKEINHIDEDKTNNRAENLEWCDRSYNCNFGSRNERISKRVAQINPRTNEVIRIWNSTHECQRYGFNKGAISQCCRGKRYKTHHGFKWQYLDNSFYAMQDSSGIDFSIEDGELLD